MNARFSRRGIAAVMVTLLATSLAACSDDDDGGGDAAGTVKVGLLVPLSGVYEGPGTHMRQAFELRLELNDNMIGGREVDLSVVDSGGTADTARPAAERLIKQDEVDVIVGVPASDAYLAVSAIASENQVPVIGLAGRPELEDVTWLWHVSFVNGNAGEAAAPYINENVDGKVFAIGPDYAGGWGQVGGFTETYTGLGGELANSDGEAVFTPWPDTADYTPWLNEIANSDAEAVWAFYAGAAAIEFINQYAQSDAADIPLYGPSITSPNLLPAQGEAAEGVWNVEYYAPGLDNQANQEFVSEWSAQYEDVTNIYSLGGWDAYEVLDQAISAIGSGEDVDGEAINTNIGELGTIESPRGDWQFSPDMHAPIQHWYLQQVAQDGGALANVVIEDLDTIDPAANGSE